MMQIFVPIPAQLGPILRNIRKEKKLTDPRQSGDVSTNISNPIFEQMEKAALKLLN